MNSAQSDSRITLELMEHGFLAGGACGLLAFIPMLFVTQRGPEPMTFTGVLPVLIGFSIVGAVFGTLLGPVLGWVNVRRVPIGTIALQTAVATFLGEVVVGIPLKEIGGQPVDSLILGGIVGAALATARLRFFSSHYPFAKSQSPSPRVRDA
jgi:hypothetical protein